VPSRAASRRPASRLRAQDTGDPDSRQRRIRRDRDGMAWLRNKSSVQRGNIADNTANKEPHPTGAAEVFYTNFLLPRATLFSLIQVCHPYNRLQDDGFASPGRMGWVASFVGNLNCACATACDALQKTWSFPRNTACPCGLANRPAASSASSTGVLGQAVAHLDMPGIFATPTEWAGWRLPASSATIPWV
jgi:hypothetical protein